MLVILALLFVLLPIFRKKESQSTQNEREYFETLKGLNQEVKELNDLDDKTQEKLKSLANKLYGDVNIEEMINRDIKSF